MNNFAERLHYLRTDKKLTGKALAEKLNVSERLVYYWESGKRECTLEMLVKISNLFEVSTDFLLGKTDY